MLSALPYLTGALIALSVLLVVLGFLFYKWYHTYHGNLPKKFIIFLIVLSLIIAGILAAVLLL